MPHTIPLGRKGNCTKLAYSMEHIQEIGEEKEDGVEYKTSD